jgi:hypothetical protein
MHNKQMSYIAQCRTALADLQKAYVSGSVVDGRDYAWDFSNLPPGPREWLGKAQLLATDRWSVLLYDDALDLLGMLSFHDRQVQTSWICQGPRAEC